MRPEEQRGPFVKDNTFLLETGWVGDELTVTVYEDKRVFFEIDEPWQGSTETGFGARCSTELTRENALKLVAFLTERLGQSERAAQISPDSAQHDRERNATE